MSGNEYTTKSDVPDWIVVMVKETADRCRSNGMEGGELFNAIGCLAVWLYDMKSIFVDDAVLQEIAEDHLGHPPLAIDRGGKQAQMQAFYRLHYAGAYMVRAQAKDGIKKPIGTLYGDKIAEDADGNWIYDVLPNGVKKYRKTWGVRDRDALSVIAGHVAKDGIVFYYAPGLQGITVVDCDPLDDEAWDVVTRHLGEPICWYYSSGNWKPKTERGIAGYGGHLVYKTDPSFPVTRTKFALHPGQPSAGEIFGSTKTAMNAGYAIAVWDAVKLVEALDADDTRIVPTHLFETFPIVTARHGGDSGMVGGNHGRLLDTLKDAGLGFGVSDEMFEAIAKQATDRLIADREASVEAAVASSGGVETNDVRLERGKLKMAEKEAERAVKGARKKREAMRDKMDAERLGTPELANAPPANRSHPKRAYWCADGEASDHVGAMSSAWLSPSEFAQIRQFRSDHLQHALRCIGLRSQWMLKSQDIIPYIKASKKNGLWDLVGEDGVVWDIEQARKWLKGRREREQEMHRSIETSKTNPSSLIGTRIR